MPHQDRYQTRRTSLVTGINAALVISFARSWTYTRRFALYDLLRNLRAMACFLVVRCQNVYVHSAISLHQVPLPPHCFFSRAKQLLLSTLHANSASVLDSEHEHLYRPQWCAHKLPSTWCAETAHPCGVCPPSCTHLLQSQHHFLRYRLLCIYGETKHDGKH